MTEGALRHAERDPRFAAEWFPLQNEVYHDPRLDSPLSSDNLII